MDLRAPRWRLLIGLLALAAASLLWVSCSDGDDAALNGRPVLSEPAAAPAARAGHVVVAAYASEGGVSRLLNPETAAYHPVEGRVVAVAPNLRYAVLEDVSFHIVDTRSGAILRNLGSAEATTIDWSPDGRWLARAHRSGPNREDESVDQVELIDLVDGRVWTVPIGDVGGCPAYGAIGWLGAPTSYALSGCQGASRPGTYALVGTDRTVTVVTGLPAGATLYGQPLTEPDHVVLLTGSASSELTVYDLRARAVVERIPHASLPSDDRPLPGNQAGARPLRLLDARRTLVARTDGELAVWDSSTGASRPAGSLTGAPLDAIVQPAGGLSDTAASFAIAVA